MRITFVAIFVPHLCDMASKQDRVFLLGAADNVAAKASKKLEERYPGIIIAGTYSPLYGLEIDQAELGKSNTIL